MNAEDMKALRNGTLSAKRRAELSINAESPELTRLRGEENFAVARISWMDDELGKQRVDDVLRNERLREAQQKLQAARARLLQGTVREQTYEERMKFQRMVRLLGEAEDVTPSVARDKLEVKQRQDLKDLQEMTDRLLYDPQGFRKRFGVNLETEGAMEWQLKQWHYSTYNYSKLSKFHAGGMIRWMEKFNATKLPIVKWSLDDFTTLYKTIVMAKVSTMLRIPLADEATRFITEGINPLVAWKKARMLKDFDKMPGDIQFHMSDLIRQVSDGPYMLLDYKHKDAWKNYQNIVNKARRDPTYARFLLGKWMTESEGGQSTMLRQIDECLRGTESSDENLRKLVGNYMRLAGEEVIGGRAYNIDVFKAWYSLGYRKDGGLRKTGMGTHRFIRYSDDTMDTVVPKVNEDFDQVFVNPTERAAGGPAIKPEDIYPQPKGGVKGGVRGDSGGLIDGLYKFYDYYYTHPTLGKHWKPQIWKNEWAELLSKGTIPEDMLYGKTYRGLKGFFDGNEAKEAWKAIDDLKPGSTITTWDGKKIKLGNEREDLDLIQSWRPQVWGQQSIMEGESVNIATKARDGLYSILDYAGSKMNEMVYANAFSESKDAMVSEMAGNLGRKLTDAEIISIEEKAHFTARAYMERVMFTNVTYGGEDFMRNLILFLPAYRQFATYWAPYLAKHPLLLSMVYRANKDKEKMKFHMGGYEFNLGSMSFLMNQSDTKDKPWKNLTGFLPSGAPIMTTAVSAMAHRYRNEKDNAWGSLAGNWPFEFSGEYSALNSPIDKLYFAAFGTTLPWPFGSDPEKNLYYAIQIQNESIRKHDVLMTGDYAMWKVRVNKLLEGGWNFFVPLRARVDDSDVQNMMTGRRDYTAAKTPEEIAAVLNRPGMELFRTFLEWQNLPDYERLDYAALHPEIAAFAVSGYSAGDNPNANRGILYSKFKNFGVADPQGYMNRVDDWWVMVDKVSAAKIARAKKVEEETWWYQYKADHAGRHDLDRLQTEWETSTGAFSAQGPEQGSNNFYTQGKRGLKVLSKALDAKLLGITDPYTGITYNAGDPLNDAYRLAKFMDQVGGATRARLKFSPNYEMYVLAKQTEQRYEVQNVVKDLTEQRMASRMTTEQIRDLGYSEKDTAFLFGAVRALDNLWNETDAVVKAFDGGYASSEGRIERKRAIIKQNAMIHSSALTERFFGDNVAALFGDTYLTKPMWERADFIELDKMDPEEKEMFLHLTTELDPETGKPRLSVPYMPDDASRLVQEVKVLGYIPVTKNGRTTWLARVRLGDVGTRGGTGTTGVVGTISVKAPSLAPTIQMSFKQTRKFFEQSYSATPKSLTAVTAWREKLKAAKIPAWAETLIEEDLRAESWKSWLAAATGGRKNLRDTINVAYGDAPGMSAETGLGVNWKTALRNYGDTLAQLSPAFAEEWERYNGDNQMVNSILDWKL